MNKQWRDVVVEYISKRQISNDDKHKVKMYFNGGPIPGRKFVREVGFEQGSLVIVDCSECEIPDYVPDFCAGKCTYKDIEKVKVVCFCSLSFCFSI